MYGVYGSAKEEVHAPRDNSPMPSSSQSPRLPGKGKRKMEEQITAEGRVCGICFAEERRLIRGFIDCCDHYFCFLCIMEWAKIESRCPMCKQRFGSIRRPLVPGVFSGERIFRVPARDQVYSRTLYQSVNYIFYAVIVLFRLNRSFDYKIIF